jgi:hypothetical protein
MDITYLKAPTCQGYHCAAVAYLKRQSFNDWHIHTIAWDQMVLGDGCQTLPFHPPLKLGAHLK